MEKSEPTEVKDYQANGASSKPRILLAASGSVAAIKFANLCHCFSEWAEVKAVATKASLHFLDTTALPKDLTLYTDENEWSSWKKIGDSVLHIELRRWADIMVIAPLSANTLAKIAGGLCDNLLTCIVRAWDYKQTDVCGTCHEYSDVEQPLHRTASNGDRRTWNFPHPTSYKEACLWGLWKRGHG